MTDAITSQTNPRVKAAVRLRDRAARDATGLTIVDGAREILRALDAGVRVETTFLAEELIRTSDAAAVAQRLRRRPSTVVVSPSVLAKIAFGARSDGIVAVVETPRRSLTDIELGPNPLLVIVEGVEKPGNLGAVLRTADAVGAAAVIVADGRTDPFNPNAIRASLGTIFTVPVIAATTADTLAWLGANAVVAITTLVDAPTDYTTADLTGPLAVVLGSEAAGLSAAWATADVRPVSIPMLGLADSLNVSVAAAVVLYEAVRQRALAANAPH